MGTAATVQFEITARDAVSPVLANVNRNLSRTAGEAARAGGVFGGTATEGTRKYQNAITNLALSQVGLTGTTGKLVESLLLMGIGGTMVGAVALGFAAIGAAIKFFKGDAEEARKATEDLRNEILATANEASAIQLAQLYKGFGDSQRELNAALKETRSITSAFGGTRQLVSPADIDRLRRNVTQFQEAIRLLEERVAAGKPKGRQAPNRGIQEPERVDVFGILASMRPGVREARQPGFTVPTISLIDPNSLHIPEPQELLDAIGWQEWTADFAEQASSQLGEVMAQGLTAAFTAAFTGEGVAGFFKAITATVLGALGSMFTQIGTAMVAASKLFAGLRKALLTLNPASSLAVGIGLIALGAVLSAASNAVGGLDSGRGGRSSAGGFTSGFPGSGAGVFGSPGPRGPTTIINLHGSNVLDFTDHEVRDKFAALGIEVNTGTRQTVQVGHVRRA